MDSIILEDYDRLKDNEFWKLLWKKIEEYRVGKCTSTMDSRKITMDEFKIAQGYNLGIKYIQACPEELAEDLKNKVIAGKSQKTPLK